MRSLVLRILLALGCLGLSVGLLWAQAIIAPLVPSSLTIKPDTVTGGDSAIGTVTLNRVVPPNTPNGAAVSLSSSNPNLASVPRAVIVKAGQSSASFPISTAKVQNVQKLVITATRSNVSRQAGLVVQPPPPPPAPALAIRPARLDFGAHPVGSSGGQQRVTLVNTGNGPLQVGNFAVTGADAGDFRIRDIGNLSAPIPPQGSGWVLIEFIPRAPGARGAMLRFASNASGSPHSVPLSGSGLSAAASLSTDRLLFAGLLVGTRSIGQFVTLTNVGTIPLTITGIGITGSYPNDFVILSGAGPGTVPVGGSRRIGIAFVPGAVGNRSARLTIVDTAPGSPRSVLLSGTGLAAGVSLSPSSLTFGGQAVGTQSDPLSVTLVNTGNAPLAIQAVGIAGAHAADFALASGGQPGVVAVGTARVIAVRFAPTAQGARSAFLTIQSSAPGSPHVLTIAGTGMPPPDLPARFKPVLPVSEALPAAGRLGIFNQDPTEEDQDVSAIRRIADDGSVYVLDYAGTALLRLPRGPQVASVAGVAASGDARVLQTGGAPEIVVDTTRRDPVDGVGLARLLRVETNRAGVSVLLALRADHHRALYRVDRGALTRLALLPGPTGPAEMAISDAGQIAYVAPDSTGAMALVQTAGAAAVELLRQGRAISDGGIIAGFSDLSSNSAGELALRVELANGDSAVLRVNRQRVAEIVARAGPGGSRVARDLLEGQVNLRPGVLTAASRPRIGANGTVVFWGGGAGFGNLFVDGPGRRLQPALVGPNWSSDPATYNYEVADNGAVCLWAARGGAPSALFLGLPSGAILEMVRAGGRIQPVGRPTFASDGPVVRCFFAARVPERPRDRQGRVPLGLYRGTMANGRLTVDTVAEPGDPVPGKRGAVLLRVTQRAVVAGDDLLFGVLYRSGGRRAVPTASLFRVPVGGKLADGSLVADEGAEIPDAGRLAILRHLSFQGDGTLVLSGLLPGAGPVVAALPDVGPRTQSVRTGASIAAAPARIQATGVAPLLSIGQAMDPPDRRLLAILGRPQALGTDRQLLVARYSQSDGLSGEGLFTVDRTGQVSAVAATGDAASGLPTSPFTGFADTSQMTLNPPAVAADGSLVFKALLEWGQAESSGVFQWVGTDPAAVAVAEPSPDSLRVLATDAAPYSLDRWVAGTGGAAYLMARPANGKARLYKRVAVVAPGAPVIQPLVVPDVTLTAGAAPVPLAQLTDLVVDRAGAVFVSGMTASQQGLFRVDGEGAAARLTAIALQGQVVPAALDGTNVQGFQFSGGFALMPDTAQGTLLFRAQVAKTGQAPRQGLFRLDPTGLQTIMVESLAVGSVREITFGTLATSPARQTANGASAFATFANGRWSIFRWRAGVTSLVAQEGQTMPGGTGAKVVSLDPGPVLDLAAGSGPVFTLNNAGDVAFLATDGQQWGIYLFSDRS